MRNLSELTERLASDVVMLDPTDLPALAQIHEQFRVAAQAIAALAELDDAPRQTMQEAANQGEKLVAQIILREVEDVSATLQEVGWTISNLQKLIETRGAEGLAPPVEQPAKPPAPAPASTTAAAPPTTAAPAAAPAVEADSPINPDDVPLVHEFIAESLGHIESAEAAVLKLEENPDAQEVINAIFRSFHTIKGVAGFLNLKQIGALAHAAESVLDMARNGQLRLVDGVVDLVLEAIDLVKAMIAGLQEAVRLGTAPAVEQRLPALLERLRATASGTASGADAGPAVASATSTSSGSAPSGAASQPAQPKSPSGAGAPAGAEATVKVGTERLDSLIDMVGELVIAQSMVSQDMLASAVGNQRLLRNMSHLGKITRELQDLSMSMRMVPIQGVFQKMARLVRDSARKAGKEIEFAVTGGETELDRNVVEAISDPLVHMVRNSVDHGVEPPDQRLAAGKPRSGRIELKACHQAGNIVIEISDDGRGLNKTKLVKKAIAAGIVREGQELSDQEIFKLVFHAGLSTAEKLTDISGRGVGMDVVKRNVEALRGRIDIASAEGKGSTFSLRLPLTLAVIDGQVVKVGQERYIIPITSIEQSIQPKAAQISTVQNRGEICMVRSSLLPLLRLHRLFSVTPDTEDPTKALVVIVQDDNRRCCLLVDQLLGQQQVVIKSLGDGLGHVPGIAGGSILGDGNVSLILDVPGLIQLAAA